MNVAKFLIHRLQGAPPVGGRRRPAEGGVAQPRMKNPPEPWVLGEASILKEKVNLILEDNFFSWSLIANFILVILQLAILAIFWKSIPPQVPLFYSQPWGEEQLAPKEFLFLVPFALLFLTIINFCFGCLFFWKEKLLAKIFIFTNVLLAFLFSTAFLKILFLTTF